MATKNNGPVTARQRARAAKAKLNADRKARDKRVEDHATEWYRLEDSAAEKQAAIDAVRAQQAGVVAALGDENVSVDESAELLGIESTEVRALRKQHRQTLEEQPTAVATAQVPEDPDERDSVEPVAS